MKLHEDKHGKKIDAHIAAGPPDCTSDSEWHSSKMEVYIYIYIYVIIFAGLSQHVQEFAPESFAEVCHKKRQCAASFTNATSVDEELQPRGIQPRTRRRDMAGTSVGFKPRSSDLHEESVEFAFWGFQVGTSIVLRPLLT